MEIAVVMHREFSMPCCSNILTWIGTRLPNYCPECGASVLERLRNEPSHTLLVREHAVLGERPAAIARIK